MVKMDVYNTRLEVAAARKNMWLHLLLFVTVLFAFFVVAKPFANTGSRLETFYQSPYFMSVTADGGVEVTLPTDLGMPNIPSCKDLDPELCSWDSRMRSTYADGEETIVIETSLEVDGEVIGQGMLMRVRTTTFEQLLPLAEKGIEYGWVSHIMVDKGMRGQGLGRLLWQASDVMLKSVVGSGRGIHVFVDQAGWGQAIMGRVPVNDVIFHLNDLWAYIVR